MHRASLGQIQSGEANAMNTAPSSLFRICILIGRLIFAAVFAMAMSFKFVSITATATYIAGAGFPAPLALAWIAAFFELALVFCLLTGAYFRETSLAAAAYVLFLGIAFHGPSHWAGNQAEFGFFVDHFSFMAGLLFAAANGPGDRFALNWRLFPRGA